MELLAAVLIVSVALNASELSEVPKLELIVGATSQTQIIVIIGIEHDRLHRIIVTSDVELDCLLKIGPQIPQDESLVRVSDNDQVRIDAGVNAGRAAL